jgi:YebC/PmpR family DNA-binding regulatory protein
MGRIFETRKSTMMARWDKMSKAFTRVSRDIHMAVKNGGPHVDTNAALRRAIQNARALNMPKDRVEAAIKRSGEKNTADFEEMIYEGYAPHGVAVLVVAATDNPTRTASNVRTAYGKGGGNLGQSGTVSFLFKRMGVFRLDYAAVKNPDELELELIDHGLEELGEGVGEKGDKQLIVRCAIQSFGAMQTALEARGIIPVSAEPEYIPSTTVAVSDAQAEEVLAMVDRLEQDDDVQRVFHNLA